MSLRISNAMVSHGVLRDITHAADSVNRTRTMASSGKQITRPSDDPGATARALKLRESLDATRQQQRNATDAQGFLGATELGLDGITSVLQSVRELVVQGGTDSLDAAGGKALATRVRTLIEQAKDHGNTTLGGRYVFGGTNTTTPPFPATAAPPAAPDSYAGNTDTLAREIGPGVSVAINQPGSAVLGTGAAGDLLGVLRTIADHLDSGDHASLRSTDLVALDHGVDNVLGLRAANGAVSNRLDAALSRLGQVEESTLTRLSETEDADFTSTMITLNTQQTAYEAALKAGANVVQASLMDFLR